jgi:ribosomal 50S subunit-associated protein YjgA (DUF615 family)
MRKRTPFPDLSGSEEALPGQTELDGEKTAYRSRSSMKDERVQNENALSALVEDLLKVSDTKWTALGVPEIAHDALRDILMIKDPGAQARQKKFTRGLIRAIDWPALALRVEQFRAGQGLSESTDPLPEHVERAHELATQGDRGLGRFLEEFPNANRTRLRQLIKNIENCSEAKRPRARSVLAQAILDVLKARDAKSEPLLP